MIAGVLTGPGPGTELDLLQTRPQRTLLSLAIPTYNVIYRAYVSTTLVDNDNVISVAFDGGGGGTLANVLPGMTLLVGNGLSQWDVGTVRIRDYIDGGGGFGYFLIGITSDIEWIDGLFLTVIDEYGLRAKHPFINPVTHVSYMDYDIAYNLGAPGLDVKQNEYGAPVPILGSHVVLELTGANVTTTFDANQSYSCINAPTSYDFAWSCPDPTVTFTAPAAGNTDATFISAGTYIIYLSITANYAGGYSAESIAVRYVIVHDVAHPLNTSFSIESKPTGNYNEGGWNYRVTMNTNATELIIRDRTLCILVAKDWYGSTEQSIGPLVGRENIICVGWIDGESLRRSNDKSTVSFDVQGPAWWLGVQEGFPTGIDDTDVAPVDWLHIQTLDPRKGLFAFLHWRTTATTIMDCYITDDDHRLATTYTPAGSLLEQLEAIGKRINANKVLCDRYGRLFCEIDTQFIAPGSRTFPIVQTLTDRDWRDEITIERREVAEAGQVDLSGVHYSGVIPLDATTYSVFSLSPGHYPKHYGSKYKVENIALDNQAEGDLIAGLWLGFLNNEYPNIDTQMSSNYRAVDIAPRMFVWMNMAFGDTPRGIVFTKRLIPREVSFNYEEREALLLTDITFEAETFPGLAVTGDPPIEPPPPPPPPPPPELCNDPLALNFGGPLPCIYRPLTDVVIVFTATQLARSMDFYGTLPPTWENVKTSGLAGANVGTIFNCAVSSGATAWALTYKDEATLGDNGVFYCPDVLAATPTWTLICSVSTYRAATGGIGFPRALGVDANNIFYTQSVNTAYFGHGTNGVTWTFPAILGDHWCINSQHSVGVVSEARGSHQPTPYPGKRIITMDGATDAVVLLSTLISEIVAVAGNHLLETAGGDASSLYSYTDTPILNASTLILIYTGADWRHGIVSDGGNVLTVRNVDTFLMNLAVPIADPAVAFGAARGGGGFCFGLAGYGEIIWVAGDAGATSAFIALRDTGGGWTDKTGDFNTAIGAWAGYISGTMPAPITLAV